MTDIFDMALDTIFNDPNLGVDGVYQPPSGAPTSSVRLLKIVAPLDLPYEQANARIVTEMWEVRMSELATPEKGGSVTVGSDVWLIKAGRIKDESDRIWILDVARS